MIQLSPIDYGTADSWELVISLANNFNLMSYIQLISNKNIIIILLIILKPAWSVIIVIWFWIYELSRERIKEFVILGILLFEFLKQIDNFIVVSE